MKITIYELLGLVKDGKAPEKIKYRNKIYFRSWCDYMGDEPIDEYYYDSEQNSWNDELCLKLDDEIEIIEEVEDKEYEDIEGINYYPKNKTEFQVDYYEDGELKHFCLNKKQRYFADKINALIRNQKKIIERLEKGE